MSPYQEINMHGLQRGDGPVHSSIWDHDGKEEFFADESLDDMPFAFRRPGAGESKKRICGICYRDKMTAIAERKRFVIGRQRSQYAAPAM